MSIPRKIHYCWFGNADKTESIQKCIDSWKKYMPDYEIIEWNESNTDFSKNTFAREAYECRKWAFVTDYVRLLALVSGGGYTSIRMWKYGSHLMICWNTKHLQALKKKNL